LKDRRGRKGAKLLQGLPGNIERVRPQFKRLLASFKNFGTTRVHHPSADVFAFQVMVAEELINIASQMLMDHVGHTARENDTKTLLRNVPAHHILGVWIEHRARINNARTVVDFVAAPQDYGSGAIAEKPRGNQIRGRKIVLPPSERAQLDGNQRSGLMRKGAHI